MHWLFCAEKRHITSGFFISTPKCSFTKSIAARMERNEPLLQHRGPPISATLSSDFAVILCKRAKGSIVSGVDFEMIEINIPELTPAPQAPQKPQAPPGTFFLDSTFRFMHYEGQCLLPRFYILSAVQPQPSHDVLVRAYDKKDIAIIFSIMATGFLEVSCKHNLIAEPSHCVWQSLQT